MKHSKKERRAKSIPGGVPRIREKVSNNSVNYKKVDQNPKPPILLIIPSLCHFDQLVNFFFSFVSFSEASASFGPRLLSLRLLGLCHLGLSLFYQMLLFDFAVANYWCFEQYGVPPVDLMLRQLPLESLGQ